MSSFVSLLALTLTLAGPTRAGVSAPPATLSERVAREVVQMWHVPLADLRITWGIAPAVQTLDAATPFRLLGTGADGWFAVVFNPANRPEVGARFRAGVAMDVPVAARAVRAGARLTEEDVRFEERVHWGAPTAGTSAVAGPGWLVRRSLSVGAPLAAPAVSPPPVVDVGHTMRAVYTIGSIEVSMLGVALNAAALGEPVRIRTTGRIGLVRGIVTGPDEARVTQ